VDAGAISPHHGQQGRKAKGALGGVNPAAGGGAQGGPPGRAEAWSPGGGRRARRGRGGWLWGRDMPGPPALEVVQEGPMDGTPPPLGADCGEALGHHRLQQAAHELQRWA
jgi:hypothetical protein